MIRIRRYAGAVVAVVQHVRDEMGRAKAMDAAVRLLERRWADVVRPLHDFYRGSSRVEDPLDDLEARYAARGEQLQKERENFTARLEIERDLVKAHKERGDAHANGWGMTAQELEGWKLRCLEAEANLAKMKDCGRGPQAGCGAQCFACLNRQWSGWMDRAKAAEAKLEVDPMVRKIDRLARPWRAVKCNGPGPEQYNVARERPHDPAKGFYSAGSPVLSYDHFLDGGFTKEQAERHAKQLNDDLADDSL